jgi:hypothetical protein
MAKHAWTVVCLVVASLSWPNKALPQTASPDALAAAKELIIASKAGEQVKALVPLLMQQLKPAIVQNRPQVERSYDAMMPIMLEAMNSQIETFMEATAVVYANNFTAEEMREIAAFYRRPVGQKLLQKLPVVMQQTMMVGQKFGEAMGRDLEDKIREELRKRGHNI